MQKRTTRVKSIATIKREVLIDNEVMAVKTTSLFQRIIAVTTGNSDLARLALEHELTPFPLSMFDKQGMMRKSEKSKLYKEFTSQPIDSINLSQCKIVIDGEFLLHNVVWPVGSTYERILKLYEDYIVRHYGRNSIIVFDGYTEVGIKSYERLRRSKVIKSEVVMFEKETKTINQSKFLSNDKNKDRLISFLADHLMSSGIEVKQASEDADRLIVTTAIEQLARHQKVVVVGQNVDLLVLLIALTPEDKEIHFLKQGSGKEASAVFSTKAHSRLKNVILFSHAFTGCDTTCSLYKKGKRSFLNILKEKEALTNDVAVFNNSSSTKDNIRQAGERLMLALYGANQNQLTDQPSINSLRFERFGSSTARLIEVRLALLPPTAGATEEHVWRVYLQVQKWRGNDQLDPREWGWELKDNVFFPIMTKVPSAPQSILEMIHCTCKGNCSNQCGCRKAGLKCSRNCSRCHGDSCLNRIDSSEDSNNPDTALLHGFESALSQQLDNINIGEQDDDTTELISSEDTIITEGDNEFEDSTGPSTSRN